MTVWSGNNSAEVERHEYFYLWRQLHGFNLSLKYTFHKKKQQNMTSIMDLIQ